jgi:AcrR family transcriptional regulator
MEREMATKRLPAAQRKKQILRCAIHVFAQKGYHGSTTKRISQEAGVAEALIYRYFGSKEALFVEAIEKTGEKLVEGVESVLEEYSDNPSIAMSRIYAFYLNLLVKQKDMAKMIFLVSAELDEPVVRKVYLPYQERALKAISRAVKSWQIAGILREDVAPRAGAWMLLGGFHVLALMKHSGKLDELNPRAVLALVRPFLEQ